MDKIRSTTEKLRKDFCPPIEESTFLSICSDHDLGSQEALQLCVRKLEIIRTAALEADTSTFDTSGTGALATSRHPAALDESKSSRDGAASWSQEEKDIILGLNDSGAGDLFAESLCSLDATDEAEVQSLRAMFPNIKVDTISYRLRKCNGNISRTIDELLNSGHVPKGVDGFTQMDVYGRGRKGKRKRLPRTNDSTRSSSPTPVHTDLPIKSGNAWKAMSDDVAFISGNTILPEQSVKVLYDAHHRSLGRTISSLAIKEGANFISIEALDDLTQIQFSQLRSEFPKTPEPRLYGILIVSGNMLSSARELVSAMVSSTNQTSTESLGIVTRYPPIELLADVELDDVTPSSVSTPLDYVTAKQLALQKETAGRTAFLQSNTMYVKGRSDPLMRAGTAHYSELARENINAAREMNAHAADSLVRSQSTSTMLDLHGVSVADAVRIAKDRTAAWWQSLGDRKYASGGGGPAREGYRVVTGKGRHSKDGASKIGPAVVRMLMKEGWKVTEGQGEVFITGKVGRS